MIEFRPFHHSGRKDGLVVAGFYVGRFCDGELLDFPLKRYETLPEAFIAADAWRQRESALETTPCNH